MLARFSSRPSPATSESPSRRNVNLHRTFKFLNSGAEWEGVPIMAANMSTVGTFAMAKAFAEYDMPVCLHKHYSTVQLADFFNDNEAFYTLGIKDEDFEKLEEFRGRHGDPRHVCLDVANGYTRFFVEKCKRLRDILPRSVLMAGNVCTPEMVQELLLSGGVDIVKIGIGPGSACTTRLVTGVGYPQLSSTIECADAAHGLRGHICADGGCTCPGDVAKAFGAGADFVMLGGMLSGHDQCEGEWEVDESGNKKAFRFYGMSSDEAMEKFNGGKARYKASEGRSAKVPYRGSVEMTIEEILGGLRSTCTYVGTENLKDLSKCCKFVRVNNTHNRIFEN
ncbi:GMP reductase [bacterium]|nr:GMP reductase [bacterium]